MRFRIVRNRQGQVVCAAQMEQTALNEVLAEPVLEEGEQAEDIDVMSSELLDLERFFATYAKAEDDQK